MEMQTQYTEEILDRLIGAFRQYTLQAPKRQLFVSRALCEMTGYSKETLTADATDAFAALVHPDDRALYADFLQTLTREGDSRDTQYRLVTASGKVVYVNDHATVKREESGLLTGYSVLTDITALKTENSNLRFLDETVPCGLIKYTCEKNPKITYVNDQMLKILRFPEVREAEADYLELYRENIYLAIPMEERRRFSYFLNRVYDKGAPIAGELSVLRCDGTKARLYGWVTKVTNAQGAEEFQSICMDVTERYQAKRASQTERYLRALSEIYDKIFEYDFSNKTVKYVYGKGSDAFGGLQNVSMQMEEATEQWIRNSVLEEDWEALRAFFRQSYQRQFTPEGEEPQQIRFRFLNPNGALCYYGAIFLKIDSAISLFCCRSLADGSEIESLRSENLSLKNMNENMRAMVMRFTEGIAAFKVTADRVTPLYSSDNICEYFGFTKEEWMMLMQQSTSIKEFVSRSGVGYERFMDLLSFGEAEFEYFDNTTKRWRRIKAICSQKQADGNSPRYVLLYNVDAVREKSADGEEGCAKIYIRTFGYFDVFVDEKPIAFRNKKSKELFALLVDRRGGYVSSEEAISFLWEDEPVNAVTLARYRKVALRLKNILEEYGITDIVDVVDGKRRIVTEKVRCDLYDYLKGNEEYAQLFKGSYLTNYSWGEVTLGELNSKNLY